jgi:hypothetical protein
VQNNLDLRAMNARKLRIPVAISVIAGAIAIHLPGLAQRPAAGNTAVQPEIGTLETRIETYEHALGVVATLARPLGAEVECNGICYFSTGTNQTSWRCAPKERCELYCDVNPPVGGCK